jgi:hypothetical protein
MSWRSSPSQQFTAPKPQTSGHSRMRKYLHDLGFEEGLGSGPHLGLRMARTSSARHGDSGRELTLAYSAAMQDQHSR